MNGGSGERAYRSSWGRVLRLTRKELRETLRDRRTVITLVLMPLLVYPLLSISFNKTLILSADQSAQPVFSIGVDSAQDAELLEGLLTEGGRLLQSRTRAGQADTSSTDAPSTDGDAADLPQASVELRWFSGAALETSVSAMEVHAAVRIKRPAPDTPRQFGSLQCELIYREQSPVSQQAMRFVEERLRVLNEVSLRGRLARLRAPTQVPAEIAFVPIATSGGVPFSLATLVPLVLILMTITGSVYPAIDLTAGERERGTLETLIAAPISRMTLLVAKYVAVLVVAVLTAMVNLVAMTMTLLTSSLGRQLFPEGLSPVLMAEVFALMILFAAFFSAVVLALTSFARSFKEAQAYLIPVMLLAISPGLLSLMPGLELSGLLAVAPLVNIVLLSRDILEGNVLPMMAGLAIVSTVLYAGGAIFVASRIFGNDALLYASRGSWSELFQRPTVQLHAPTPTVTLTCLATLFPLFFVLANLATGLPVTLRSQLFINAAITTIVFGLWPLIFAFAQRVSVWSGFQIAGFFTAPSSPVASEEPWADAVRPWWGRLTRAGVVMLAAALLGLSLWPFAYELFLLGNEAGLVRVDRNQFTQVQQMLEEFRGISPAVLLLSLAVVPGVMEEFFFRGYLFTGLRKRFRGWRIVLVTGLLFGLFHVLSPSSLMPERFLPSTFLGLVLGWVCYRASSIVPGMLLHAMHNALLILMVQHHDKLAARGWDPQQSGHVPGLWLLGCGAVVLVGCALLYLATRGATTRASEVD